MKDRYRLARRGNRFYAVDRQTLTRESLGTNDTEIAERILAAKNEATQITNLNLALGRTYLSCGEGFRGKPAQLSVCLGTTCQGHWLSDSLDTECFGAQFARCAPCVCAGCRRCLSVSGELRERTHGLPMHTMKMNT